MAGLQETKGIIFNFRQYPSDFLAFSLANLLMEEQAPFALVVMPDRSMPGRFLQPPAISNGKAGGNPHYYKGKIMLLMDERSQSQPEYTIMALRRSPNATVVGSTSAGADGNVAKIGLPGGLVTVISSLGIYYPDGTPTQRVGLAPDVWCYPTVEGIRAGRDELVEKAVELIRAE